ncbi:YjbQ family protein, partial [Candidatus Aerophobetes bacterium]|nr:YjbQ family protein [Candidatus Aerophobetes bacterium]
MRSIEIRTSRRVEFVDITAKVEKIIGESQIEDGICILFVPHTTAGITINEGADPSVRQDIMEMLNKLV